MEAIDARTFLLIVLGTTFVVQALKKLLPRAADGREDGLALVLPVLFTVAAKLGGLFQATPWEDALIWALSGGAAAGVAHDKALNPALRIGAGLLSLLKGRGGGAAGPPGGGAAPPSPPAEGGKP
jgi:hypothetical protein